MRIFIILLTLVLLVNSLKFSYLKYRSSSHVNHVMSCLNNLVNQYFNTQRNSKISLTLLATFNLSYPAYEIQRNIIKQINLLRDKICISSHLVGHWSISVLDVDRDIHLFESYAKKHSEDTQDVTYYFIPKYKSNFYVIVIDNIDKLNCTIEDITNHDFFNPSAKFIIYYAKIKPNSIEVAKQIGNILTNNFMFDSLILIPKTTKKIQIFTIDLRIKGPYSCVGMTKLDNLGVCDDGKVTSFLYHHTKSNLKDYNNCTIKVLTMKFEPYVMDVNRGVEIQMLKILGNKLNIWWNFTLDDYNADWGSKINGTWSGNMGVIQRENCIAIGSIVATSDIIKDFDFTRSVIMEDLVWVIPIAGFIPKWRVLSVIFSLMVWSICFAVFIVSALLFYYFSKFGRELKALKSFSGGILNSFQIIISYPVFSKPVTDIVRVIFTAEIIYSLIISCVYTTSLIDYLTKPVREYQIKTMGEIASSGLDVGGLEERKEDFNVTGDPIALKIYESYKTYPFNNDSSEYWLEEVANTRKLCTIMSRRYVKYILTLKESKIHDALGRPKIYISNNKLFSFGLNIFTKRGFPMLENFDDVVYMLVECGIITHFLDEFDHQFQKMKWLNDNSENGPEQLSMDHMQGAFAIVVLGYLFGCVAFLGELCVYNFKREKERRKRKDV